MATSGDFLLATSGDFLMAMDSLNPWKVWPRFTACE